MGLPPTEDENLGYLTPHKKRGGVVLTRRDSQCKQKTLSSNIGKKRPRFSGGTLPRFFRREKKTGSELVIVVVVVKVPRSEESRGVNYI